MKLRWFVLGALSSALVLPVVASDPPDSIIHPLTGEIESVDATWQGTAWNVRHVIDAGAGQPPEVTVLTVAPEDDLGPRIEANAAGNVWVVWWRDQATDGVYVSRRDTPTGEWEAETLLSDSGESSRNPEIVHQGLSIWVVYEFDDGSDTAVAASRADDPFPFPDRTVIATTDFGGNVDTAIHAESGRVWVTWIDSSTFVGWSDYDENADTWSVATYESYASDSVADARARIRDLVLAE